MTDTVERPAARLEARDIVFEVDAARLLDGVNLDAGAGELIGVVGPNGAGKTTLLRTIGGLLKARRGVVTLDGAKVRDMGAGERAKAIARVAQIAPLTHGFTALELVLMGRYPHMGRLQAERGSDREIALRAMDTTETAEFAGRPVDTLSGGEQQRVFVARALAQEPRLMLLDEPTSNLDIQHQVRLFQIVRGLVSDGMTAVAAVHDLSLAARFCDRLVLLSRGRIVAEGVPAEVLTPASVEKVFGVRAAVSTDPATGALNVSVIDTGSSISAGPPAGLSRIHLVCGGGTGARLMYRLSEAGYRVTAGPLGTGDTDRSAAESLGVEFVPVSAFGGIDGGQHKRHLALVRDADLALLTGVPFGAGNLRCLEALSTARRVACLAAGPFPERDFTGGAATTLYSRLTPVASWPDVDAALAGLARLSERSGKEAE